MVTALASTVFFSNCTKTGPAGPAGTNGTNGAAGTNGKNGNANVQVYIATVTSWTASSTYYYTNITAPNLTQNIQDSGAVNIYVSLDHGTTYQNVPNFTSAQSSGYQFNYQTQLNKVIMYWSAYNGTLGVSPISYYSVNSLLFKIVCVQASNMPLYKNVNFKDYNEVKRVFDFE